MATYMHACNCCRTKLVKFALRTTQTDYLRSTGISIFKINSHGQRNIYEIQTDNYPILVQGRLHHTFSDNNKVSFTRFNRQCKSKEIIPKCCTSLNSVTQYHGLFWNLHAATYCTSSDGNQDDGKEPDGLDDKENVPESSEPPKSPLESFGRSLMLKEVPKEFPNVPVIAVNKYPVFPKFKRPILVRIRC